MARRIRTRMASLSRMGLLAATGLLLAAPAAAVPLEVSFTGSLGFVPDELGSGFTGDAVSGSFRVDSEAMDGSAADDVGPYPSRT